MLIRFQILRLVLLAFFVLTAVCGFVGWMGWRDRDSVALLLAGLAGAVLCDIAVSLGRMAERDRNIP